MSFVQTAIFKSFNHIVIIRDDSAIEIFSLKDLKDRAILQYETKESETITGVIVGNVTSPNFKEILFTCYSGAVKSLVHRRHIEKMGTLTEDALKLTQQQVESEK